MLRICPKTQRHRPSIRGWWAYFGSFGDDIFGDDLPDDDEVGALQHGNGQLTPDDLPDDCDQTWARSVTGSDTICAHFAAVAELREEGTAQTTGGAVAIVDDKYPDAEQ